jgi:transposase
MLSSSAKDTVVVCVRMPDASGARSSEVRTFWTMTEDLLVLRDWLSALGVSLVGMESTGVYWRPIVYMLEDTVECWLLNARHLRNVPGHKTDVADAEWIAQLVEHGLGGRASFRRRPSASCAGSPGIARARSKSAPGRSSASTRCSKTPR